MTSGKLSELELAAAHAEGAAARIEFDETLQALLATITSVDQVEVLARVAFSLFFRVAFSPFSREDTKGRDPKRKGVEIFHVEILQALALSQPRRSPLPEDDYAGVTQSCIDLIEKNEQACLRLSKINLTEDVAANQRQNLIALVQNWTLAVRGLRHFHQTHEYSTAMAADVDASFGHHFGCTASAVIEMLENVMRVLQRRIQVHIDGLRSWLRQKSGLAMIEAFVRDLPADQAARIRAATLPLRYNRKGVNAYLWNELESRYAAMFTFTFDEVAPSATPADRARLRAMLECLSMTFGDITDETLQHLPLSNPVRLKLFVRLDAERFFCCSMHGLGANLTEIFEDLCATKPSLKERLERARAKWLEAKLCDVVRRYLPHAEVHREIRWTDVDNGKGWEADVVAIIDKTILIFEAKSAKIGPPARRGALNSLRRTLKELVVDPSEQSLRLKRYIESASQELRLRSAEGTLVIDPIRTRDVIRVNILLDAIGPLSAHWPQMKAAGLLPENTDIAPTMSVFELETVFEVLSLEIERCHYLSRRVAFERNATYTADELDLLAFYLETQFNVGNEEFDGTDFKLYGWSLRLTAGYTERREADTLHFPIKRAELWKRLLASLEETRPEGWTRFGHRLLNVDLDGQKAFERRVRGAWKAVLRAPGHFFTTGFTFGPWKRRQTIAFAIGAPDSPEQFNHNVQYASHTALEQGGTTDLLLIYWFIPATGEPYDFIGVMRKAQIDEAIQEDGST